MTRASGSSERNFVLFFGTSCVLGLPFFFAWLAMFLEHREAKSSCNHIVDAFVVAQTPADVHGKCDLTLRWQDVRRRLFRETIVVWECDPAFAEKDTPSAFPESTCYKDGEEELRVMNVDRYDYYDHYHRRRYSHTRHYDDFNPKDYIYSEREIRFLKRTWIALLVMWVMFLGPLVVLLALACFCGPCAMFIFDYEQKVERKKGTGDNNISGAIGMTTRDTSSVPTSVTGKDTMLPAGFVKSDTIVR
jgi:hypothetical protein